MVYRGLGPWQGIALGVSLSICALTAGGCGGGGGANGGSEHASVQTVQSAKLAEALPKESTAKQVHKPRSQRSVSKAQTAKPSHPKHVSASDSTSSRVVAPASSSQSQANGGQANGGGSSSNGNGSGQSRSGSGNSKAGQNQGKAGPKHGHKKHAPKPSSGTSATANPGNLPVQPPTPPAGDPYASARQFCGSNDNLQLVPPQFRSDPEHLATLYAQVFDPQHQQAAHDGCLAGLHDLGIS